MLTFSSKGRISRLRRGGSGRGSSPSSGEAGERMDSELPDEQYAHKGWHDSSGELKRGLDVTEDVPLEALPPDLRAGFVPRRR
jgi:hypothetical protein